MSLLLQHRINDGRVYVEVVKACARHVQWEKALLVKETRSSNSMEITYKVNLEPIVTNGVTWDPYKWPY